MEAPRFIIRASETRVIIPQIFKVAGLSAIFYIGVWLNAFLLEIDIPAIVNLITIAGLMLLVIVDIIVQYIKTRRNKLELYLDRAIKTPEGNTLMWTDAGMTTIETNILDKIFKTATISLGSIQMPYVKEPEKIKQYLEQYRQYGVYYARYPKQNA